MNAEILCIGTELVLGDILNTNAQYLSKQLALKGINVFYQSCVGDNPERIIKALSIAVTRSNLIIFTGGLGPTADDITIATVANALSIPLEKNDEAYEHIKGYFKRIGKPLTDNNEKQAFLPKGCIVLPNDKGTAPGCVIESGNQCIVFLPGPPKELQAMYENHLIGYLDKYADGVIKSKFVHIYGVGECMIDEKAAELIKGKNPTVAPYAKDGEAELRITAKSGDEESAQKLIDETLIKIQNIFGDSIYGFDDVTLESVVVSMLKAKGLTVATAESCTAGYISKRITDISGASKIFNMGVSTYSNESKTNELGVPAELIKEHGAVSKEVAACMAKGVREKSGADIGLSITGIAGPKSDESKKPVGLSYIGISDKNGEYVIKSMKGGKNDREYIRFVSASEAINFLRLYLLNGGEKLEAEKINAVLVSEIVDLAEQKENEQSAVVMTEEPKKAENSEESKIISQDGADADKESQPEKTAQIKRRSLYISNPVQLSPKELIDVAAESYDDEDDIVSEQVSLDSLGKKLPKNKTGGKMNIMIDQSEYKPVEDDEFKEMDIQLEEYEEQLKKERKKGFFKSLVIHKDDTSSEKVRKTTFWIALIVFIVTLSYIAFYFINPLIQQAKISAMSETYHSNDTEGYYSSKINPKFKELYEKNSDIIGWITIDGTNIDYPVMQNKEDGEYYLRKGFNKTYSREGSIFADENSSIEYGKETKNIMLYGHHMVSTGTMFKELDKFQSVEFYKKNPTITFDSLYRDSEYKVFAVFITNSIESQDNGNFYNYRQTEFSSEKDFEEWINEAKVRSLITTDVNIDYTDEILTLQTCNDSFESDGEKARLIVMARRVRDGESKEVDTSGAKNNAEPKYPQMWYDINGEVNPYYTPEEETATTSVATTTKKTASTSNTSATYTSGTVPTVYVPAQNDAKPKTTTTTTKKTTKPKTTSVKTTKAVKTSKTTAKTTAVKTTVAATAATNSQNSAETTVEEIETVNE